MATFLHSFRHKLPIRILILAALFCNLKSFALDTWGGQVGPAPSLTNTTYTINKCRELAWVVPFTSMATSWSPKIKSTSRPEAVRQYDNG